MEKLKNKLVSISRGKRIVALVLCCIACMTMSGVPVSASGCNHGNMETLVVRGTSEYYSVTQCRCRFDTYSVCKTCGYGEHVNTYYVYPTHNLGTQAIDCDGRNQTVKMRCNICGWIKTVERRCPAGPHAKGQCPALPAGVKPEDQIK